MVNELSRTVGTAGYCTWPGEQASCEVTANVVQDCTIYEDIDIDVETCETNISAEYLLQVNDENDSLIPSRIKVLKCPIKPGTKYRCTFDDSGSFLNVGGPKKKNELAMSMVWIVSLVFIIICFLIIRYSYKGW